MIQCLKKILIITTVGIIFIGVSWYLLVSRYDLSPRTFIEVLDKYSPSQNSDKFIITNPIDLDEIISISQFRSCMGHDFSGKNIEGEKETNRSMKHYITQKNNVENAKAIAPFNGRIVEATKQQIGQGTNVFIKADDASEWIFIFFHIDLEAGLKDGSSVKAGEIMGRSAVGQAKNFDFALKKFGIFEQSFDTPFYHMTDEILAEYEKKGLTTENIVISKEQRDASPCIFDQGSGNDEQVFFEQPEEIDQESFDIEKPVSKQPIIEDNTIQAVPAPGFEDVPEMIVNMGDGALEHEESEPEPEEPAPVQIEEVKKIVKWDNTKNGWEPIGTPPECPDPLQLVTPTDLTLVTSVLYPGQYRGGNYKPHGGFRYDNSQNNEITITAPMDARVVDGGRSLVNGEIQYMFDFIAPCGIWYRLGHLRELSPKFQAIAETLPQAVEGDSRTHGVDSATVTAGEIIATSVGFTQDNNTFVDWGVYDLRSKNIASQDPTWAAQHTGQQSQNAICWFDLLSPEDEQIVRSLPPADGVSGATSDYCL